MTKLLKQTSVPLKKDGAFIAKCSGMEIDAIVTRSSDRT